MTDSALKTLCELRSKKQCEAREVAGLIIKAGSMRELYRLLMHDPRPEDRLIVIHLLKYETLEHEQNEGLSDHLIICAYLLARHGNVEDCLLIWDAKIANFSTFLGLSSVLLVGAGIDETIRFLRTKLPKRRLSFRFLFNSRTPRNDSALESAAALRHIEYILKAGRFADKEEKVDKIKSMCMRFLTT